VYNLRVCRVPSFENERGKKCLIFKKCKRFWNLLRRRAVLSRREPFSCWHASQQCCSRLCPYLHHLLTLTDTFILYYIPLKLAKFLPRIVPNVAGASNVGWVQICPSIWIKIVLALKTGVFWNDVPCVVWRIHSDARAQQPCQMRRKQKVTKFWWKPIPTLLCCSFFVKVIIYWHFQIIRAFFVIKRFSSSIDRHDRVLCFKCKKTIIL